MSVDWNVTAREVLALDADADIDSTRRVYETHLARASWMTHTHWLSTAPEVTSVEGLGAERERSYENPHRNLPGVPHRCADATDVRGSRRGVGEWALRLGMQDTSG